MPEGFTFKNWCSNPEYHQLRDKLRWCCCVSSKKNNRAKRSYTHSTQSFPTIYFWFCFLDRSVTKKKKKRGIPSGNTDVYIWLACTKEIWSAWSSLLLSSTFSSLQLNGLILQQVPFLGLAPILLFPTTQGWPLFSWIWCIQDSFRKIYI